jgi:hypothetical protein
MNQKISIPLFAILAAIFVMSFASADIAFIPTSQNLNGNHNSDLTITFTLNNTGTVNYTAIDWSSSTTVKGSWRTLPSSDTLNAGENKSFSAVLSIPAHESNSFIANIHALTTPAANANLPVTINVIPSRSLDISDPTALNSAQNATMTITNTGNADLNHINLTVSGDLNVSFSQNNFALPKGNSTTVNVNSLKNINDLELGDHSITVLAKDLDYPIANDTQEFSVLGVYCKNGNINDTKVTIDDISDVSSNIDNEWEWKPLDNVEIEVKVGNDIGRDKDFVVRIALYDREEKDFIEIDGDNYLEQEVSINDGDSEKVKFEFQVPVDVEDSDGRYVLYVKAYVSGKESSYCSSYAAVDVPDGSADSISITKKSKDIVLNDNDLVVSPELVVQAGDTVHIGTRAYNIGTEDQDKVKVTLYNLKLGLNLESSSFVLDSGDSEPVDFSFVVPYTAENGVYTLKLDTYFDYKKSSDLYTDHSDTTWEARLTVAGGTGGTTNTSATSKPLTSITATLDSDAIAGKELVVTALIKNLAIGKNTFVVDAKDFESWATLKSISDRILTLNGSESKEVTLTFDVDSDASGEKTFTIETKAGDKIDTKQVAVTIGEGSSWTSSLSGMFSGNKTLLWIIGGINLILIILIIVLAVRILKR